MTRYTYNTSVPTQPYAAAEVGSPVFVVV